MISSMTGFGRASYEVDGAAYSIEIRTVNNRYLKTILRLSDFGAFLVDDIERLLRKEIHRGTVNYSLSIENIFGRVQFNVDEKALNKYIAKLQTVAKANGIECRIDLADMLTLPGIVQPATPDAEQAAKIKQAVLELTVKTIEQLKQMRAQEGEALVADLIVNCDVIREKLSLIREQRPVVLEQYHDKLKKRVEELLSGAQLETDAEILAREVAVFADKSDIAEELARLESHLSQFVQFCKSDESSGRKLDFISQEMLREVNTIASKAADAQIARCVIDIKCAIDRLKEQVQNVE